MVDFKPQNPEQHFAQQRTNRAAEAVTAVLDAQRKDGENTRAANERFYNGLALYSGGTIALSVTFMGYLKTLSKPPIPSLARNRLELLISLRSVFAVLDLRLRSVHLLLSRMAGSRGPSRTSTRPTLKSTPPWSVVRGACKPKLLYRRRR